MLSITYSGHRVHQEENEIFLQGYWYGQRKEKASCFFLSSVLWRNENFCILLHLPFHPVNERCVGVLAVLKSTKLEKWSLLRIL